MSTTRYHRVGDSEEKPLRPHPPKAHRGDTVKCEAISVSNVSARRKGVLVIEYDVKTDGLIDIVALINVIDEDGTDPTGESWLQWRRDHEDDGLGCAPVPPEILAKMEATEDPDELWAIVESVILEDRRTKEEVPA